MHLDTEIELRIRFSESDLNGEMNLTPHPKLITLVTDLRFKEYSVVFGDFYRQKMSLSSSTFLITVHYKEVICSERYVS